MRSGWLSGFFPFHFTSVEIGSNPTYKTRGLHVNWVFNFGLRGFPSFLPHLKLKKNKKPSRFPMFVNGANCADGCKKKKKYKDTSFTTWHCSDDQAISIP